MRRRQCLFVVLVHELHPMAMGETVIGGIEVAALVALGLIARVEQHRVHAVLVGKGEIEDLELDWHGTPQLVRADLDLTAVETGKARAVDVDLDPYRLVLVGLDRDRQSSAAGSRVFGHELHRLPARRVSGCSRRALFVHPRRVRGHRHVHVVNGEDLDRSIDVVRGIVSGRPVGDAVATRAELGQSQRELIDATIIGVDDHLKRHDLIARARDMDHMSVPRRIVAAGGMVPGVPRDFLAVVDGPDPSHTGVGVDRQQGHRNCESNQRDVAPNTTGAEPLRDGKRPPKWGCMGHFLSPRSADASFIAVRASACDRLRSG